MKHPRLKNVTQNQLSIQVCIELSMQVFHQIRRLELCVNFERPYIVTVQPLGFNSN